MTPPRSPAPAVITAIGLVVLILGVWPNHWFEGKPKIDRDDSYSSDYDDYDSDFGSPKNVKIEFGLREVSSCMGSTCASADYEALVSQLSILENDDDRGDGGRGQLKKFVWAGRVTFWCAMASALALLISLLMWTTRQRLPFSMPAVGGALAVVTALAGTFAFITKPVVPGLGELVAFELEMGLGYPLCLLGALGAAVGAFHLHKDERGFAQVGAPAYGQPYYGQPPYGGQPYGGQPYQGGPAPYAPQPMTGPTMQISPACPRCTAPTVFVAEHQRYFCSTCRAYL